MSLNPFSISGLILSFTATVLLIIILRSAKYFIHYIWALFNFAVAVWGFACIFIGKEQTIDTAIFWLRIGHVGVIFIAVFFYHVIYLTCRLKNRVVLFFIYIIGCVFALLAFTNHFISKDNTVIIFNSFYYDKAQGIIYPFYLIFWMSVIMYGHLKLAQAYFTSKGAHRNQILYFFLGMLVGFMGGITNFLPVVGLFIYPIGNFTIPLYCIIVTYAILKYNIMDIKLAITRTGLFIAVYTLVLGLPFAFTLQFKQTLINLIGPHWWIAPLVLMAFFATIGPFIYIFFQKRTEARLLKEQRRYQNTLKHAAIGMTRIRNIHRLLNLIAHIVTKTVHISFASIYLIDDEENKFTLQANRHKNKQPVSEFPIDAPLIVWLNRKKRPLILDELSRSALETNDHTKQLIIKDIGQLGGTLIIPSFLEDKLLGFIVLGDKLSGQMYTQDDLNVFQVLASQAALAIENAQFYEQAKEMQAQIAQAEKMATIGTMADGLSHQINNRFYALSLIAGDSIDTIKMTDTSNCTPEVQEMIKQINQALERIQNNVMQGGEVVKGILKYTRKGEEGIEALTMDQIIDGTLDMVQYKVKLHEFDLIRDYPKDLPKIRGNLVQMEEAFFNFIDNAYDAINERKITLQEPGYRGQIKISAKAQEDMIQINIQDNGMGVKKDDIKKIFTPFFSTKVSSRKGTGLGLYVIHSIITENHNGRISFDSTYKTGTTFTIHIPLAKT